ncbi:MAG: hypothetical protein QXG26_00800 [Candidatus Aenigmatarchaeota archaeon]
MKQYIIGIIIVFIGIILIYECVQTIQQQVLKGGPAVSGWVYVIETSEGIKPYFVTQKLEIWDKDKIKEKTGINVSVEKKIVPQEIIDFAENELSKCLPPKYIIEEWVPCNNGWLGISSSYMINNETKGFILPRGILLDVLPSNEIVVSANCICEPEQKEIVPPKDKQVMEPRENMTEEWPCATDDILELRKQSRSVIDEYIKTINGRILFDYYATYVLT